jgi:YidC/Oxa1 family membrane protein insertase
MIIVFLLRGTSTLLTFNNVLQQQKMQDVQLKVAKINAKYEKYKDNPQMKQRKQLETMKLYKKEGINPLGSLSSVFLTMPMFLAM